MKKIFALLCFLFFSPFALTAQSPNVLLITLDTTRADHVGCYGGKNVSTPNLDALAAKGVLFEEARAHCPLTLPSHATILTGKFTSTLNVKVNGSPLDQKFPLIQEKFKQKGYKTFAMVSAVILQQAMGLSRGFDIYDDRMAVTPKKGDSPEERRAEETTTAALAAMENTKSPYFLWVHYYDPHYEYDPPEPYKQKFRDRPYDGEIAYMDAQIGRLMNGLSQKGLLKNTLIVVAGDHGEGLMEHGERTHGTFLYEYALRVPLIMAFDGRIPSGKRVSGLCALSDVAPTILELAAVQATGFDGRSLVPMFREGAWQDRAMYIESYNGFMDFGWAPLRGIVDRDYKFIDAPKPELYRYRTSEYKNIYREEPEQASKLRKELSRYPDTDAAQKTQIEKFLKDPSNADNLKQLMSLGYLSGLGMRPDNPGLMDPKDGIGIVEEVMKGMEVRDMGRMDEAKGIFLGIIKKNPTNIPALLCLGQIYLKENELEKAKICFQQELALKPCTDEAHLDLGTIFERQGNLASAEKEYRAAITVNPRQATAVANLSRILMDQKRPKEAKDVLEKALGSQIESADVYFQAGVLCAMESDFKNAEQYFKRTLSLDPLRYEATANLAQIAARTGRTDEAISLYEEAVKTSPKRADYYQWLGWLYQNARKDGAKALYYYKKALAIDPDGKESGQLRQMISKLERETGGKGN